MCRLVNDFPTINVGLVHLWAQPYVDNRASGLVYGFENLGKDMQNIKFCVDYLCFSNKKKNGEWHPLFREVPPAHAEILNEYDFIIFGSAGSLVDKKLGPWWKPILDSLETPFAVQINNEVDKQDLRYRDLFYDHPHFSLGLPITEGLAYASTPNRDNLPFLVYECLPRTDLPDPEMFYGQKRDQIVTTCRITTRKIVEWLLMIIEILYPNNRETIFTPIRRLECSSIN